MKRERLFDNQLWQNAYVHLRKGFRKIFYLKFFKMIDIQGHMNNQADFIYKQESTTLANKLVTKASSYRIFS